MNDSSSKNAGFTLIEVLLAFTILLVGMTGILALFTTALGLQSEASQRLDVAKQLAAVMGQIESDLADKIAAKGGALDIDGETFPVPGEEGRYRYRVSLSPIPGDDQGRGSFAHVEILSLRRGADQVYDMGSIAVVPQPDNDRIIQKLLSKSP